MVKASNQLGYTIVHGLVSVSGMAVVCVLAVRGQITGTSALMGLLALAGIHGAHAGTLAAVVRAGVDVLAGTPRHHPSTAEGATSDVHRT